MSAKYIHFCVPNLQDTSFCFASLGQGTLFCVLAIAITAHATHPVFCFLDIVIHEIIIVLYQL